MRNISFVEGEKSSKLSSRRKVNAENNSRRKLQVHFHKARSMNKSSASINKKCCTCPDHKNKLSLPQTFPQLLKCSITTRFSISFKIKM